MSESIAVDKKGRLLIPRRMREAVAIDPPTKLLALARGSGRIELIAVDPQMKTSREIARKKLSGWREEKHEADRLALELASQENK